MIAAQWCCFHFLSPTRSSAKVRPAIVTNPAYPSDDLLVVAVTSVAGVLRPGEFPIRFWREAGLIHPSFVKRAVASVSAELIRKQLGRLDDAELAGLDSALRLWFGL
jgi:hypothetical protein